MNIIQFFLDEIRHQIERRKRRQQLRSRQVSLQVQQELDSCRPTIATAVNPGCYSCKYLHGLNQVVCGIHPYGWEWKHGTCPDWEARKK